MDSQTIEKDLEDKLSDEHTTEREDISLDEKTASERLKDYIERRNEQREKTKQQISSMSLNDLYENAKRIADPEEVIDIGFYKFNDGLKRIRVNISEMDRRKLKAASYVGMQDKVYNALLEKYFNQLDPLKATMIGLDNRKERYENKKERVISQSERIEKEMKKALEQKKEISQQISEIESIMKKSKSEYKKLEEDIVNIANSRTDSKSGSDSTLNEYQLHIKKIETLMLAKKLLHEFNYNDIREKDIMKSLKRNINRYQHLLESSLEYEERIYRIELYKERITNYNEINTTPVMIAEDNEDEFMNIISDIGRKMDQEYSSNRRDTETRNKKPKWLNENVVDDDESLETLGDIEGIYDTLDKQIDGYKQREMKNLLN